MLENRAEVVAVGVVAVGVVEARGVAEARIAEIAEIVVIAVDAEVVVVDAAVARDSVEIVALGATAALGEIAAAASTPTTRAPSRLLVGPKHSHPTARQVKKEAACLLKINGCILTDQLQWANVFWT
jgi:hypothetical protein